MRKFILFITCVLLSTFIFASNVKQSLSKSSQNFGPTVVCDDLWHIARGVHKSEKGTTQQIMVAFLKKNPKLFYKNNINGLFSGFRLSIPSVKEILATSPQKAEVEVKRQNVEWKKIEHELEEHPSREYLDLRRKCCTRQHFKRLVDRLYVVAQTETSSQSVPLDKKTVHKASTIEDKSATPQNEITRLTKENQFLKSKLNDLMMEKNIIQNDNLIQWAIIENLQQQLNAQQQTPKTIPQPISKFSLNHGIRQFFLKMFQSKPQIHMQNCLNAFRHSALFAQVSRLTDRPELFLTLVMNLIVILVIILLWALNYYRKPPICRLPSKLQVKETEEKDCPQNDPEIESEDIMATKLDLARVYIDMGENERARGILANVLQNGDDVQKSEAKILFKEIK